MMMDAGIDVYALKGLHSKLYLFDDTYGVLGSANFTAGGFKSNIELSLLLNNDDGILKELHSYFDDLLNKIKQSKEGQSNQGFFHEGEEMPETLFKILGILFQIQENGFEEQQGKIN